MFQLLFLFWRYPAAPVYNDVKDVAYGEEIYKEDAYGGEDELYARW